MQNEKYEKEQEGLSWEQGLFQRKKTSAIKISKSLIKIVLWINLILGLSLLIKDYYDDDLQVFTIGFVSSLIPAFFIVRSHNGKLGRIGWIIAGIFTLLNTTFLILAFYFLSNPFILW